MRADENVYQAHDTMCAAVCKGSTPIPSVWEVHHQKFAFCCMMGSLKSNSSPPTLLKCNTKFQEYSLNNHLYVIKNDFGTNTRQMIMRHTLHYDLLNTFLFSCRCGCAVNADLCVWGRPHVAL